MSKEAHMEELDLLEKYLDGHGFAVDAIRVYIKNRRAAIEMDFGEDVSVQMDKLEHLPHGSESYAEMQARVEREQLVRLTPEQGEDSGGQANGQGAEQAPAGDAPPSITETAGT